MQATSFKVSDSLYLVCNPVSKSEPAKLVEVPTNHVVIIDCSGSMSCDLPNIRTQLKQKLPKLLRAKDTISIIWFSGRNQCGILLEAEKVAGLEDLKAVEDAIDRWLRPVCLTGFKEPLELAATLIAKLKTTVPGNVSSLFFISDGCDNCSSRTDVLKVVENLAPMLSSATFVEYGYYADRPLLTQMAQTAGGALIFAEDFPRYAPSFEAVMQRKVSGASKISVKISGEVVGGFAFAMVDGDLLTFSLDSGVVQVPEDLPEIWYASSSSVGKLELEINAIAQNVLGIKAA
jgi:hypothetical protein